MDIKILYENVTQDDTCTFYEYIQRISSTDFLRIASPYVNVEYLKEFTSNATSWRLITDSKSGSRLPNQKFTRQNKDSIRDCRSIHAKVVIGDDSAYLGSANLTQQGLKKNTEIGAYFTDEQKIKQLNDWFDDLWNRSSKWDAEEEEKYVSPAVEGEINISSENKQTLSSSIECASSKDIIKTYFNYINELITLTDLAENDKRISATIPNTGEIAININNRYVLKSYLNKDSTGMMIRGDGLAVSKYPEYISNWGQFSVNTPPIPEKNPYWFNIPNSDVQTVFEEIKDDWISAVEDQMKRASISNYRSSHNPAICRAAVNKEFCRDIIEESGL